MLPADRILRVASPSGAHLMKSRNPVTMLELAHVLADCLDDASNVVSLVDFFAVHTGKFPTHRFRIDSTWEEMNFSNKLFKINKDNPHPYQSLGLHPLTTTLINT